MRFAKQSVMRLPATLRLATRNGRRSMLREEVVSVKRQMPQGVASQDVDGDEKVVPNRYRRAVPGNRDSARAGFVDISTIA